MGLVKQFRAKDICCSIFLNTITNELGTIQKYSINVQKVYNAGTKDQPDLKNTQSFTDFDIPKIAYVLRQAEQYIYENKINK